MCSDNPVMVRLTLIDGRSAIVNLKAIDSIHETSYGGEVFLRLGTNFEMAPEHFKALMKRIDVQPITT